MQRITSNDLYFFGEIILNPVDIIIKQTSTVPIQDNDI